MFEQAELPGTQMGPDGPPNAKRTAKIAPEIANYGKPGLWGSFLAVLAIGFGTKKMSILVILASQGRQKAPLGVLLKST